MSSARPRRSVGAPTPVRPRDRRAGEAPAVRGEVVQAAGAVCWRRAPAGVQVLLVHRSRYRDWSWPKGKLDPGEGAPEAAVREVEEETGLRVQLGTPLPTACYRLHPGTDKQVTYWAAQVTGRLPAPPHPHEVDRTRWVSPQKAAQMLTRRGDRAQLEALLDARAQGRLETWPLLVVRHGKARARKGWAGSDAERPLAEAGEAQSQALVALLGAWTPRRLVSSPWRRCMDTVTPYATSSGTRLVREERLSEAGHQRHPDRVAALVSELVARRRPVAVCTHRPVLGTLLGALVGHCSTGVGDAVPPTDPFLATSEILVAHVSTRGRVVAVERHQPVTD